MSQYKVTLRLGELALARAVLGALSELFEPPPDAATLFEDGNGWRVEAYYSGLPDLDEVAGCLDRMVGRSLPPLAVERVPENNWVAVSQAALPPVAAGRFTIHGSHDRQKVHRGPRAIEIDAGEAFGTAHHATTLGCLEAIGRLGAAGKIARVLDLGCGSGILAIALARTFSRARIVATDIDPVAIDVARANAQLNGVQGRIRHQVAAGLDHPVLRRLMPFDLVVANILADPLIEMAPAMAGAGRAGGTVILSGILNGQADRVGAAYRTAGFSLTSHRRIAGWSVLSLQRRP